MRLVVCLIPLLCGCSTPSVRCDGHLQPINAPAPGGAAALAPPGAPVAADPAHHPRSAQ
jgi:hypothetical protein